MDFAKNRLEIAVEKGNPKHIATLSDLTKPGLVVVLCDPSAPCGKYAAQVLDNAKVKLTPKSLEANVKATLSKVELGEADAAIVYVSDVASSGKVDGVQIPDNVNVLTTLPIVALKDSKNAALAKAWVDFVVRAPVGAREQVRLPSSVSPARATARRGQPAAHPRRRPGARRPRSSSSVSRSPDCSGARRGATSRSVLRDRAARDAVRLSLICSLSATGLSVLFGIPIAWLLARGRFAGLNVIRALASSRWSFRRWWVASRCSTRSAAGG